MTDNSVDEESKAARDLSLVDQALLHQIEKQRSAHANPAS